MTIPGHCSLLAEGALVDTLVPFRDSRGRVEQPAVAIVVLLLLLLMARGV